MNNPLLKSIAKFAQSFASKLKDASTSNEIDQTRKQALHPLVYRGEDIHHKLVMTLEQVTTSFDATISIDAGQKITMKIPAGIDSGMEIRSKGNGMPGRFDGEAGDLFVEIEVKEHPVFRRDGCHLHRDLQVPTKIAISGGKIETTTLKGTTLISIPAKTQNGHIITIPNEGLKGICTNDVGDLFVHVQLT